MKITIEDVKSYVMINLAKEDLNSNIILDKNSIGIFYLNSEDEPNKIYGFIVFGNGIDKLKDLNAINFGSNSNFAIINDIMYETRSENKTYNCRKLNSLARFEFKI